MTDVGGSFTPIPTREIPPPVLELADGDCGSPIPRVLLQCVGSGRAARRVLLLSALFAAFSLVELGLLLHLPTPEPLVVYGEFPRTMLVGGVQ